ncbi:MAG: DUF4384 domain-containing protein [Deltaproteobacteria bacterium]|nr:MAG: DUF4384 domain-containing protein [Deltaproteobacteria bacterium]
MSSQQPPADEPIQDLLEAYGEQTRRTTQDVSPNLLARLHRLPDEHPHSNDSSSHEGFAGLWFWRVFAGLSTACVVLFGVWVLRSTSTSDSIFTPKGFHWNMLYAHTHGSSKGTLSTCKARNGEVLHPDDVVQFTYKLSKPAYVVVAGLTQKGDIYPLVLGQNKQSAKAEAGKGVFPRRGARVKSFQLDGYLGFERFFFIVSSKPVAWNTIKGFLSKAWSQQKDVRRLRPASKQWKVESVWIHKKPLPPSRRKP